MSTATPVHQSRRSRAVPASTHGRDTTGSIASKAILISVGAAALWAALVAGMATAARLAGMSQGQAWAFAIGIVSYIHLFVGFVLLLVRVISKESGTPAAQ